MAKVRVDINQAEIGRLLRGEGQYVGVKVDLRRRALRIAEAAGDGMVAKEGTNVIRRARWVVITETSEAMQNEASNRTLTRALDAGR